MSFGAGGTCNHCNLPDRAWSKKRHSGTRVRKSVKLKSHWQIKGLRRFQAEIHGFFHVIRCFSMIFDAFRTRNSRPSLLLQAQGLCFPDAVRIRSSGGAASRNALRGHQRHRLRLWYHRHWPPEDTKTHFTCRLSELLARVDSSLPCRKSRMPAQRS